MGTEEPQKPTNEERTNAGCALALGITGLGAALGTSTYLAMNEPPAQIIDAQREERMALHKKLMDFDKIFKWFDKQLSPPSFILAPLPGDPEEKNHQARMEASEKIKFDESELEWYREFRNAAYAARYLANSVYDKHNIRSGNPGREAKEAKILKNFITINQQRPKDQPPGTLKNAEGKTLCPPAPEPFAHFDAFDSETGKFDPDKEKSWLARYRSQAPQMDESLREAAADLLRWMPRIERLAADQAAARSR